MIFNSGRSRRRQRSGNSGSFDRDPLDRDYGYGYSDEGRPITNISDEAVDNRRAQDPDGDVFVVNMAERPAQRVCAPGQHQLQPTGESSDIPGTREMKCAICGVGHYERIK